MIIEQIDDLPLPDGIPPSATNQRLFRILAALKAGLPWHEVPAPYCDGDTAVYLRFCLEGWKDSLNNPLNSPLTRWDPFTQSWVRPLAD